MARGDVGAAYRVAADIGCDPKARIASSLSAVWRFETNRLLKVVQKNAVRIDDRQDVITGDWAPMSDDMAELF